MVVSLAANQPSPANASDFERPRIRLHAYASAFCNLGGPTTLLGFSLAGNYRRHVMSFRLTCNGPVHSALTSFFGALRHRFQSGTPGYRGGVPYTVRLFLPLGANSVFANCQSDQLTGAFQGCGDVDLSGIGAIDQVALLVIEYPDYVGAYQDALTINVGPRP